MPSFSAMANLSPKNGRIHGAFLKRGKNTLTAHSQDRNFFIGIDVVMRQNRSCGIVGRAADAGDSDFFSFDVGDRANAGLAAPIKDEGRFVVEPDDAFDRRARHGGSRSRSETGAELNRSRDQGLHGCGSAPEQHRQDVQAFRLKEILFER
jgi:hypothetical protein